MYEHHRELLLPKLSFIKRISRNFGALSAIVVFSLLIGRLGYRLTENMGWIEAFYNASLIMSGMGPEDSIQSNAGRVFASIHSLYSGFFMLVATGLLLLPVIHRMLHSLHLDSAE